MNNKLIYTIVAIVLVLGAGIAVFKMRQASMQNAQQTSGQTDQTNQIAQETNQATNNSTPPTDANGCPNGVDPMPISGQTRFKPTVNIAHKAVVLDTSMGKIKIDLYDTDAPKTVENFICLAEKGYYNNVIVHRISKGFVIQAGDPKGDGTGGESVYGATFEDELYPETASYKAGYLKGVVAMANRGPRTNGSQFFIMLGDHPELPHAYTIFGKVSSGMDVVSKIGAVPIIPMMSADDGAPKDKITIKTATVVAK